MNMKQSWFVIVFAVLTLAACGKKSEESAAANAPPPLNESNTPVAAQPAMQPSAEQKTPEKMPEKTASTSAADTPATSPSAEMKKPIKASDRMQPLSREEGLALAGKSGCLACHKIESKLVGPAWRDVSKRYKGDPGAKARLVAKVKAGGKGNWTEVTGGVSMPPYSPRVSDENIEKLVTFVLSQ
jgi:cytochrome c